MFLYFVEGCVFGVEPELTFAQGAVSQLELKDFLFKGALT
jgi:hypothetical protein